VFAPATVTGGGGGGDEEPPPETGIALSATGYKVKGVQHADLTWRGAISTDQVVISRIGSSGATTTTTTTNDGQHTDNIGNRGGGSYTYQVCDSDGPDCSNTVTVSF